MEAGYQEAIPEIDLYLPRHIGDSIIDSLNFRGLCDGIIFKIDSHDIPLELLPSLVDNVLNNAKNNTDLEEIPIDELHQSTLMTDIISNSL